MGHDLLLFTTPGLRRLAGFLLKAVASAGGISWTILEMNSAFFSSSEFHEEQQQDDYRYYDPHLNCPFPPALILANTTSMPIYYLDFR